MMIEERLEKIETLLQTLVERSGGKTDSEKIEALIEKVATKKPTKDFYSVAEISEIVGRSPYQVRKWCKEGRIKAQKRASGYGPYKEWMIAHDELTAYQSLGLRAAARAY